MRAFGWHGQQLPAVSLASGPSDAPEPHCVPDAEVKRHLYAVADLFVELTGRLAQCLHVCFSWKLFLLESNKTKTKPPLSLLGLYTNLIQKKNGSLSPAPL